MTSMFFIRPHHNKQMTLMKSVNKCVRILSRHFKCFTLRHYSREPNRSPIIFLNMNRMNNNNGLIFLIPIVFVVGIKKNNNKGRLAEGVHTSYFHCHYLLSLVSVTTTLLVLSHTRRCHT